MLLAIIGITRPTNFLIVLVLLFFGPNKSFYLNLLKSILSIKSVFKSLFIPLVILSIPLILWKLQTGSWIVYSYGEEGFNFSQPEIFNFLFSYTKGWFLYTPIALLIIIFGGAILLKSDKKKATILIAFLCLSIYIFSSWWCWYYGAGMSQRVMIDYTILLGFLLALILQKISLKPYLKKVFLILSVLFIGLNIVQAYQISIGILPNGSPTKEQYWDNFLAIDKKAKIYPQKHWKLIEKKTISLDPKNNQVVKGFPYFIKDDWQINVSDTNQYSPVFRINSSPIKKGSKLIFCFDIKATTQLDLTRLVVTLSNGETPVFFLKEYSHLNDWVRMEFLFEPLTNHDPFIDLYFWNAGSIESAEIKNVQFFHYYTEEYF